MSVPALDISTSTNLQHTPLNDWHIKHGAKMVPFAGYTMPVQYPTGIIAEHHHTRQKVGLFDISHMGVILVKKSLDHLEVLEALIPIDITEMQPGQMRYGVLLNEEGCILDDLILSCFNDYWLIVVNAGCKENDFAYLKRFLACELLSDVALLALQGPKARAVLENFIPESSKVPFMTMIESSFMDELAWVSCSGYTGEDGFEFIIPSSKAAEVADRLLTFEDVKPIGLGARDSLRLEAGLCLYGHDIDDSQTPVTANLVWSLGKRRRQEGNFLGSDRILDQIVNGVPEKRVGFRGLGPAIAREGATIHAANNEVIGIVTSGCPSPTLSYPIAMGYLDSNFSTPDTPVFINIRGQLHPFVVARTPFVPHQYFRG